MKLKASSLRVVVLGGMGSEGYGGAWVGRGVALAMRHDRRMRAPHAVYVYRSSGEGSWGKAYLRTREIVLKLSGGKGKRGANLGVLLHELRHLAQDPLRNRKWREADARAFAKSVIEAEKARRKGGSK